MDHLKVLLYVISILFSVYNSFPDSNQESTRVTFVRVGEEAAVNEDTLSAHPQPQPQMQDENAEFVSQDAETLDLTEDSENVAIIDADAELEDLIAGEPVAVSVPVSVASAAAATTDGAAGSNPILMLDQDQISRLENVLKVN